MATFYDEVIVPGSVTVLPGGNALFLTNLSFVGMSLLQLGVGSSEFPDNSSLISSSGSIALSGTLEVSLDGGYDQLIGQPLQLISAAGGITGAFDSIQLPLVPNDLEVGLLFSPTGVSMEVKTINTSINLPGDYNNDGTVDAADYAVWRNNLGSPNSLPNDDTPGVDQADYAALEDSLWRIDAVRRRFRVSRCTSYSRAFHCVAIDHGVSWIGTDSTPLVPRQEVPRPGRRILSLRSNRLGIIGHDALLAVGRFVQA